MFIFIKFNRNLILRGMHFTRFSNGKYSFDTGTHEILGEYL